MLDEFWPNTICCAHCGKWRNFTLMLFLQKFHEKSCSKIDFTEFFAKSASIFFVFFHTVFCPKLLCTLLWQCMRPQYYRSIACNAREDNEYARVSYCILRITNHLAHKHFYFHYCIHQHITKDFILRTFLKICGVTTILLHALSTK